MSSTTGVQNLLVNVFRPVYAYDPAATVSLYTVKLDASNINAYYGNNVDVLWANVGDTFGNVYVGKQAGNDPTITSKNCSNVTAIGFSAGGGISNVQNSVYLGYYAGKGSADANTVISIGTNTLGNGVSNIFIGNKSGTLGSGSSNILIGHDISLGAVNDKLRIGVGANILIAGDFSNKWVGIGGYTSPVYTYDKFDVSGNAYFLGNVGINIEPGTRTLDVNGNFRAGDASSSILDFSNGTFKVMDTVDRVLNFSNGTFKVTDTATKVLNFSNGITTSTGGFLSATGTATILSTGTVTIGPVVKRGVVLITAVATGFPTSNASRTVFASTPTSIVDIGSNISAGGTAITFSGSNIQVSGSIYQVYTYCVTYFPLP